MGVDQIISAHTLLERKHRLLILSRIEPQIFNGHTHSSSLSRVPGCQCAVSL